MGLDVNGTRFLLFAKTRGVRFDRTATLGRQGLHLDAASLRRNLSDFGYSLGESEVRLMLAKRDRYAEPFLEFLGATEVRSFDASPYENATDIHDFNLPIPEHLKAHFDVVIDGGSLEHIFNLPVAVKNCMEMVTVQGHFLGITPANNFFGHGFYQFSPELFFRIFSAANGFEVERLILFEDRRGAPWFDVVDPEAVRQRIPLVNSRPTYLLVLARKVADIPVFATMPQQSDFVTIWSHDHGIEEPATVQEVVTHSSAVRKLRNLVHFGHYFRMDTYRRGPYNPTFFKRIRRP